MASLYGSNTAPKTELLINGTWTDITSSVRADAAINITRGRANEQQTVAAQTASFSINNRDGKFSNRNPLSPYYGLLPRNTQVRVSAGSGDNYVRLLATDAAGTRNVSTTDKATLDITGDIDIRAEIWPHDWRTSYMIASKYAITGDQRSWAFYTNSNGTLVFVWSTDGTSGTRTFTTSTVPISRTAGRIAVKVTLDVDNGASGNTVTFSTASSIGGTYTQLGSAVVNSGTTSIFSSSANLVVGAGSDSLTPLSGTAGFAGRVYTVQVRNGIGGSGAANMDATSQAIGTTSWSDGFGTPNTWTLNGTGTRLTSDRIRFWGELSSLPQVWDKTGRDVYVPVTASGMIRRLTQGAKALNSAMYRNFRQYNPTGWWPLEDGPSATTGASYVNGSAPMAATNVTFGGSNTGLPGAASVATFNDATSKLYGVAAKASFANTLSMVFYVKLSSLPASGAPTLLTLTFRNAFVLTSVTVGVSATNWVTTFIQNDGGTMATSSVSFSGTSPLNKWVGYNLLITNSGSNFNYSIRWDPITSDGVGVGPVLVTNGGISAPGSVTVSGAADTAYNSAQISHVFVSQGNFDLTSNVFRKASSAWLGETAGARITRLAAEESIPVEIVGQQAQTEPMGYQTVDTFMNLVQDAATTDGGILSECRDLLSLNYRCRTDLENRADVLASLTASVLSDVPTPVEDDQNFTNDVTVTTPQGDSYEAVVTDGATSISPPPAGVGVYNSTFSRNLAYAGRLPSVAGWIALTQSWDESRYPSIPVGMHRTAVLGNDAMFSAFLGAEVGDTIQLTGMPSFLPPDDVYELIQGYSERLSKFMWDITYNCTPSGPYEAVGLVGLGDIIPRLDGVAHSLGGSMTTTATSTTFVTPAGSALWITTATFPNDFPFNIKVAGEVMTVTAITGTSSPQTATVTRSVNGVVKTHASGELVRLAKPFYLGS